MNNIVTARKKWMGLALVLIVALAAGFRLYHLGVPSFRADTIIFFDLCHRPLSGWTIFTQWMELVGKTAQFPFVTAVTRDFLNVFHLEPTAFAIRFPNAVSGILTVLAMYLLGRQMAGRAFGACLALWLAVNPFHVQMSREAYFYAPMLLGITLQTWSCVWAYRHRNLPGPFPWRFHLTTILGFWLMTYSHVAGWWIGFFYFLFLAGTLGRRAWTSRNRRRDFWCWILPCIVLGIPLAFMSWGLPFFLQGIWDTLSDPAVREAELNRMGGGGLETPLWVFLFKFAQCTAWGMTPARLSVLAGVTAFTLLGMVIRRARYRRACLLVIFLICGVLLYSLLLMKGGSYYGFRHLANVLPLYWTILCYGIWHMSTIPPLRIPRIPAQWRRALVYVLASGVIGINIPLAWISTQLTGKPTPFKEIASWCDTQLPPRTLVLVERWFDPWNELRVYNSTNVFFTFTVPSEPKNVFEKFNWPATAKEFFNHFPDAAYLEYTNSERNRMGVVSNVYFARSVMFTNKAAIRLAKFGVAYRDEFYDPATNRMISAIFYNTREDVLRHAREQGQAALVLYGPEWGYVKLWQQLKDFRDWRILEKQASLDVYNLTASTNRVTLKMRGMALNGSKRIEVLGESRFKRDFRHLQLEEWALRDIILQPGLNKIIFSDPLWSVSNIPLLVDQIEVSPLP